jgi:prevent-host-death family protein
MGARELYNRFVEVSISTLRAELTRWIDRARSGEEIVVTERGTPVARLIPVDAAPILEQLVERGVLRRPSGPRPTAAGAERVPSRGGVADLVSGQRDG